MQVVLARSVLMVSAAAGRAPGADRTVGQVKKRKGSEGGSRVGEMTKSTGKPEAKSPSVTTGSYSYTGSSSASGSRPLTLNNAQRSHTTHPLKQTLETKSNKPSKIKANARDPGTRMRVWQDGERGEVREGSNLLRMEAGLKENGKCFAHPSPNHSTCLPRRSHEER
jgi:hypothetical protein